MLFPTVQFAVFLTLVFIGSWTLMSRPRPWRVFMVLASYIFYGFWDWRFIGLLAGTTVVNHVVAVGISRSAERRGRRLLVRLGIVANLGVLGFFKYFGFLVASVADSLRTFGLEPNLPLLEIILPVGISFFTFQAMSYVLDVYHGRLEVAPWLDFAVYLAFFPQLVAGPIVRGTEFLPQLRTPRDPRRIDASRAFYLIFIGLAKKIVIADLLATSLVDPVFASPRLHSGLAILIAMYGYSIQIYADFSAYSDIAIGVALLLGFRFPRNFDAPYTATSIRDFWRRWHMTLSRWLRDYLYIGLGGSRRGEVRTYRNLLVTMLLGGLWHGAAWRFVLWGGLHGSWLAIERAWSDLRSRAGAERRRSTLGGRIVRRLVTFHLVTVAWVFFRADSLGTAGTMLSRVVMAWEWSADVVGPGVVAAMSAALVSQFIARGVVDRLLGAFSRLAPAVQGLALGGGLMVIDALGNDGVAAFIYFQF